MDTWWFAPLCVAAVWVGAVGHIAEKEWAALSPTSPTVTRLSQPPAAAPHAQPPAESQPAETEEAEETAESAESPSRGRPQKAVQFVKSVNSDLASTYAREGDDSTAQISYGLSTLLAEGQRVPEHMQVNWPRSKKLALEFVRRIKAGPLLEKRYELKFTPTRVSMAEKGIAVRGEWRPFQRNWKSYISKAAQKKHNAFMRKLTGQLAKSRREQFERGVKSVKDRYETIAISCVIPANGVDFEKVKAAKFITVTGRIMDFDFEGQVTSQSSDEYCPNKRPHVSSISFAVEEVDRKLRSDD
ncbi:MAG: hypothetical protein PVJ57_16220 [Phycisphaerae bacterium]